VQQVILWDGNEATYRPPLPAVEVTDRPEVAVGWVRADGAFSAPAAER
jgi:hypothetical protein